MSESPEHPELAAGYGKPPHASRFRPGQSGNPNGRPRNRRTSLPHDTVVGQMVTISEGGIKRRVTAAEAFILHLTRKGLAGDSAAARASLEAIAAARARRGPSDLYDPLVVIRTSFGVGTALKALRMAVKKWPQDKSRVRWELEPWIVEAALSRLGKRQLTPAEQREVWNNTRTPHKVKWPEWWVVS